MGRPNSKPSETNPTQAHRAETRKTTSVCGPKKAPDQTKTVHHPVEPARDSTATTTRTTPTTTASSHSEGGKRGSGGGTSSSSSGGSYNRRSAASTARSSLPAAFYIHFQTRGDLLKALYRVHSLIEQQCPSALDDAFIDVSVACPRQTNIDQALEMLLNESWLDSKERRYPLFSGIRKELADVVNDITLRNNRRVRTHDRSIASDVPECFAGTGSTIDDDYEEEQEEDLAVVAHDDDDEAEEETAQRKDTSTNERFRISPLVFFAMMLQDGVLDDGWEKENRTL